MARPSNRGRILDAALSVLGADHHASMTIDAVAVESELTKAGVLYHFSTKELLLAAVYEHVAQQWERLLVAAAGGSSAHECSTEERLAAYVRVGALSASRAELALLMSAETAPDAARPLTELLDRWVPALEPALADERAQSLVLARLAADGLWISEAWEGVPVALREQLAERIIDTMVRVPAAP